MYRGAAQLHHKPLLVSGLRALIVFHPVGRIGFVVEFGRNDPGLVQRFGIGFHLVAALGNAFNQFFHGFAVVLHILLNANQHAWHLAAVFLGGNDGHQPAFFLGHVHIAGGPGCHAVYGNGLLFTGAFAILHHFAFFLVAGNVFFGGIQIVIRRHKVHGIGIVGFLVGVDADSVVAAPFDHNIPVAIAQDGGRQSAPGRLRIVFPSGQAHELVLAQRFAARIDNLGAVVGTDFFQFRIHARQERRRAIAHDRNKLRALVGVLVVPVFIRKLDQRGLHLRHIVLARDFEVHVFLGHNRVFGGLRAAVGKNGSHLRVPSPHQPPHFGTVDSGRIFGWHSGGLHIGGGCAAAGTGQVNLADFLRLRGFAFQHVAAVHDQPFHAPKRGDDQKDNGNSSDGSQAFHFQGGKVR